MRRIELDRGIVPILDDRKFFIAKVIWWHTSLIRYYACRELVARNGAIIHGFIEYNIPVKEHRMLSWHKSVQEAWQTIMSITSNDYCITLYECDYAEFTYGNLDKLTYEAPT